MKNNHIPVCFSVQKIPTKLWKYLTNILCVTLAMGIVSPAGASVLLIFPRRVLFYPVIFFRLSLQIFFLFTFLNVLIESIILFNRFKKCYFLNRLFCFFAYNVSKRGKIKKIAGGNLKKITGR
jgi:hypothetical protein